MKAFFRDIVIIAILAIAAGLAFMWSGSYDVSARVPHWPVTHWVLEQGLDRSIEAHSKGIQAPPLDDPKLVETALPAFEHMCRICHGAPDHPRMPFVRGMYPNPPDLTSGDVQENSDAELYWVIENGIKMTGMAAFGATPAAQDIWPLVALVRRLPKLQPGEYDAMLKKAGLE